MQRRLPETDLLSAAVVALHLYACRAGHQRIVLYRHLAGAGEVPRVLGTFRVGPSNVISGSKCSWPIAQKSKNDSCRGCGPRPPVPPANCSSKSARGSRKSYISWMHPHGGITASHLSLYSCDIWKGAPEVLSNPRGGHLAGINPGPSTCMPADHLFTCGAGMFTCKHRVSLTLWKFYMCIQGKAQTNASPPQLISG